MQIVKICLLLLGAAFAVKGVYCCTDRYLSRKEKQKEIPFTAAQRQDYASRKMRLHMLGSLLFLAGGMLLSTFI